MTPESVLRLQLINDKKALSERCEGVVGELKQVDQKYTKKIAQMQEQHDMVREAELLCCFFMLRSCFSASALRLL